MLWRRIEDAGLPLPIKQFYWARPERMFRSDFAYVSERILLEVQGGIWAANPGRHNRGAGYQADLSRANLAAILGWKLLAFSERMIRSGEAVATINRALSPASCDALQQLLPTYNWPAEKTSPAAATNSPGRGIKGA
jgi:very-short-patch-repair endonuclease